MKHRTTPIARAEVLGALAALADDSRLRLLEFLAANGEMRAQALVERMASSQPNVSRQLRQLVAAGLVTERRAGDANKHYSLRQEAARTLADKLDRLLSVENARANIAADASAAQRAAVLAALPTGLQPLLDEHARVAHFSTKHHEQMLALGYLISKFDAGRAYTEREATELIHDWLAPSLVNGRLYGIDAVTLRRALVEESSLRRARDGSKYWRE